MNTNILVIGMGEMGTAISFLLKKGGKSRIVQWDVDPEKNLNDKALEDLVPNADIIFLCIPSRAVRECMSKIKHKINRRQLIVSPSKGIEQESKKTVDGVLGEFLNRRQIVLLFGPMVAQEIMNGNYAAGVLACVAKKSSDRIAELFADGLNLEYSADVRGVAFSGVLKNIYAIGLGVIHGLNLGTNFRGWYVTQASKEISIMLKMLGGKKDTAYSIAGLGDLVATGFSPDSKNHMLGKDLALSNHSDLVSEGGDSFPILGEILGKKIDNFVILPTLRDIVVGGKVATDLFSKIINKR